VAVAVLTAITGGPFLILRASVVADYERMRAADGDSCLAGAAWAGLSVASADLG